MKLLFLAWLSICGVWAARYVQVAEKSNDTEPPQGEGDLRRNFECYKGEGEAYKTYRETADNSFPACGSLCLQDPNCEGFDWNSDKQSGHPLANPPFWTNDACRLFQANMPRLGKETWNREYCQKTLLEKKFQCKSGQGTPFNAYNQTSDGSFKACASLCDSDPECQSFDYTDMHPDSGHIELHTGKLWKPDSCRLYASGLSRKEDDSGWSKRTFCSKAQMHHETANEDEGPHMLKAKRIAGDFLEAMEENDLPACLKLLSDDVSLSVKKPIGRTERFQGKSYFREFMEDMPPLKGSVKDLSINKATPCADEPQRTCMSATFKVKVKMAFVSQWFGINAFFQLDPDDKIIVADVGMK
mmetsp:Transcript_20645/g.37185  ORF Transcript_20645/g.37185 Transcript_20645/m.37185 type:complete len:357 (-) Transcript_20645:110-1180(-)|eukprot:CAMPEP_0197682930 /NCGR_PEP_ID=MMETSP1338-20131121/97194_1 /TAXON_ID=43686 ORGANISM="Pelagodinium beii, Strain RCC1491" /NCGR_SAMPLE_ID=MMETSP1338 /ASSEMBLY_ACC=CAM_ASM_000754 /LENGTH=356 /DNA_ID=CAMNT_0043264447 /DNA_START=6 /DNA_END=1076 /DNA_ORIENTATION=-